MPIDHAAIERTLKAATQRLLSERLAAGHWEGELSSSALSTATAVCALALFERSDRNNSSMGNDELANLIRKGFGWLADHQNGDGGWGDTTDSPSNISTTVLCWAAFGVHAPSAKRHSSTVDRIEAWLRREAGGLTTARLVKAIGESYGKDRTFSVPILTMCALSGRFGTGREAWHGITRLPFELAALPHQWFRRVGLPVVSYALPALIAIGQAQHFHRPTRNPLMRWLRNLIRNRTLRVLQQVQPESGGFLEAAPLTSFVAMSLVSIGRANHPVTQRGITFLTSTVREDGSWPIDTNLATWVTTLSINALAGSGNLSEYLSDEERAGLRGWVLEQQYRREHPYTHAAAGGWAWTDLSGGVPDADDTPGALLALRHLATKDEAGQVIDDEAKQAAARGGIWLLDLRNRDGGLPTFCRGWGKLPFDRSSPDLTAHALRAWAAWRDDVPVTLRRRVDRATIGAIRFLLKVQREDGAWVPLWFGNQREPMQENPLYGTTRVLRAGGVTPTDESLGDAWSAARERAVQWVLAGQREDGGWGAAASVRPTIEETALAVEALADVCEHAGSRTNAEPILDAIERGSAWLVAHTNNGTQFEPAPIGLYFAKLWYFEKLYPLTFAVSALERVRGF